MGKSSVSDLSEHVFDLIQELFAIDPMLLTSVMPQLEFKLKVITKRCLMNGRQCSFSCKHSLICEATFQFFFEFLFALCVQSNDGEERLAVVRLLAKLFGAKDSELASQNRPLWQCFLGR